MVDWKHLLHLDTPTTIGSTIGGRTHWKSSARKVSHPSTIPALGGLTLEFLWDPSKGSGLSRPRLCNERHRRLIKIRKRSCRLWKHLHLHTPPREESKEAHLKIMSMGPCYEISWFGNIVVGIRGRNCVLPRAQAHHILADESEVFIRRNLAESLQILQPDQHEEHSSLQILASFIYVIQLWKQGMKGVTHLISILSETVDAINQKDQWRVRELGGLDERSGCKRLYK